MVPDTSRTTGDPIRKLFHKSSSTDISLMAVVCSRFGSTIETLYRLKTGLNWFQLPCILANLIPVMTSFANQLSMSDLNKSIYERLKRKPMTANSSMMTVHDNSLVKNRLSFFIFNKTALCAKQAPHHRILAKSGLPPEV